MFKCQVYATKRSGHHAFLENICEAVASSSLSYRYQNNGFLDDSGDIRFREVVENGNGEGFHFFSFENKTLEFKRQVENIIQPDKTVLFLRDFPNSFASMVRMVRDGKAPSSAVRNFSESWKSIAIGQLSDNRANGILNVVFNKYFFDDSYRKDILCSLGLPLVDLPKSLSRFGGGGNTAFGKDSFSINKSELSSRWISLINDSAFQAIKDDDDLIKICQEWSLKFDCKPLWDDFIASI